MKKQIIILLSILIGTLISCDDNVEINYVAPIIPQANFQVDFDGETWIADAVTATMIDGEIHMIATRNLGEEIVEIKLLKDQVGSYNFTPTTNVGFINYTQSTTNAPFATTPNELAGNISVTTIDLAEQLLTGNFFFIGKRSIQQFEADGTPMLDPVTGENVYLLESKSFTNGIFENIVYSTFEIEDPTDPNSDTFFVNMDGVEFVETTLSATKVVLGGEEVVIIRAARSGSAEVIEFRLLTNITAPDNILLDGTNTVPPSSDATVIYTDIAVSSGNGVYGASNSVTPGFPLAPIISVSEFNLADKKITATFEFTGINPLNNEIKFTEGEFSITYTD